MSSSQNPARHPVRRASGRVRAAATPIAVAGVVALSSIGLSAAPAAAAERVQHRLVADGYLDASDASGAYDARTGAAVARWQAARGLRADGLVDAVTADELLGTGSTVPHRRIPQ
ncbi:peptidoglycan-binding protein [Patulibacter sp.]|uniref:peptidoglycan-binding domain-containing protein n=1 Tax=Patulibacter sp. TaxID=1912859 RepID=UPI00271E754C|nr:peptidoglycan-binding domain-containing protein [Patulibacter sp.]MDO9406831.1 peptidoglycan-binding domain-containing protein [Patulibacter sp.]